MKSVAKSRRKILFKRPNRRWKNNIKMGPEEMGCAAVGLWAGFIDQ
jgi:hypothetical protein